MIEPEWTGTDHDRHEMRTLQLDQVVRRNFSRLAMFGFASTLLATWESIAVGLSIALTNGGTAGLFWNFVACAIGFGFVYASIAELSSMFPTSGGQYYYVAVLAPRSCRKYLSYITGWLCAITWQTGVAGVYVAATLIQGLLVLNIDTYVFQNWHGTLLTLALVLVVVFINTFLARKLPTIEGIFVVLHIIGIAVLIPVWIMAPRREGGAPLIEFNNGGGWPTDGISTLIGSVAPSAALIGFDCSVHMAEEAKDSSRTVPMTLLLGYTVNVILGFFAIVTLVYTLPPIDQALASATGYPFLDLFYSSTQNLAAASIMGVVVIICEFAGATSSLAACSRQLWSFARNHGVPFSRFFAPTNLPYDIPLQAILFSIFLAVVIALLNLGSSEALGIIFSLYNSALTGSYIITIGCVLFHRLQGRKLPRGRYTLGRWGILINTLALLFILPIFVFSFFPAVPNPTPGEMNWAIAVVGGTILLATIYYVAYGRTVYTPPDLSVEGYIEQYEATVASDRVSSSVILDEKAPEATVEEPEKKYL